VPGVAEYRRRTFLAALGSSLAACRPQQDAPNSVQPQLGNEGAADPDAITAETFAEAEKLMGVHYTDAERAQMLETVEDIVSLWAPRRGHADEVVGPPAAVVDPWPPGVPRPTGESKLALTRIKGGKTGSDEDLAFAGIAQLGSWLRAKVVTSRRLTELYLERLDRFGPKLECVVTKTPELALRQADRADAELASGRDRGPLHGIPWGAKDLIDTAGIPTTWGATPYEDRVPKRDAEVVRRLDEAGAVLIAKLTTGVLAYGDIWFGGRTRNPWNLDEGASGSSAGPASAVAAGLVGFAIGTETLGSIVSPSMRCGNVGLRPTYGRIARTGCMPLSWTLDKLGPMTRTVEGACAVLHAVAGAHPGDPASRDAPVSFDASADIAGMTVGYDPAWFETKVANDVERAALEAIEGLGVTMKPTEIPDLPYPALMTLLFVEAATAFEHLTESNRDDELKWQADRAWPNSFRWSRFISGIDYVAAQRIQRQAMDAFAKIFEGVDALVGPSYAAHMLLATNCTGHPCVTLRAGYVERPPKAFTDGFKGDQAPAKMPHGITLWGRLFDEGRLCQLGHALEAKLGIASDRPPIA
jgi:Asp-tRNA(Asn)/Glu-tRNA(Gln) amidotransferase A subunit family amidase